MDAIERVLGRLEEFKDQSERRMTKLETQMEKRFDGLHSDVKKLNEFKWRMAGGAAILSLFMTSAIEVAHFWRNTHGK